MARNLVEKPTSLSAYAKRRGVSIEAVRKAIATGRLKESLVEWGGKWKIRDVDLADREWDENTRGPARTAGQLAAAEVPPLAVSLARREAARAELAEIEVAEKRAHLVQADEVAERFVEVVTVAKTKLLGIPARIKQRLPHVAADDIRVIDDLVREALEALADGR